MSAALLQNVLRCLMMNPRQAIMRHYKPSRSHEHKVCIQVAVNTEQGWKRHTKYNVNSVIHTARQKVLEVYHHFSTMDHIQKAARIRQKYGSYGTFKTKKK